MNKVSLPRPIIIDDNSYYIIDCDQQGLTLKKVNQLTEGKSFISLKKKKVSYHGKQCTITGFTPGYTGNATVILDNGDIKTVVEGRDTQDIVFSDNRKIVFVGDKSCVISPLEEEKNQIIPYSHLDGVTFATYVLSDNGECELTNMLIRESFIHNSLNDQTVNPAQLLPQKSAVTDRYSKIDIYFDGKLVFNAQRMLTPEKIKDILPETAQRPTFIIEGGETLQRKIFNEIATVTDDATVMIHQHAIEDDTGELVSALTTYRANNRNGQVTLIASRIFNLFGTNDQDAIKTHCKDLNVKLIIPTSTTTDQGLLNHGKFIAIGEKVYFTTSNFRGSISNKRTNIITELTGEIAKLLTDYAETMYVEGNIPRASTLIDNLQQQGIFFNQPECNYCGVVDLYASMIDSADSHLQVMMKGIQDNPVLDLIINRANDGLPVEIFYDKAGKFALEKLQALQPMSNVSIKKTRDTGMEIHANTIVINGNSTKEAIACVGTAYLSVHQMNMQVNKTKTADIAVTTQGRNASDLGEMIRTMIL